MELKFFKVLAFFGLFVTMSFASSQEQKKDDPSQTTQSPIKAHFSYKTANETTDHEHKKSKKGDFEKGTEEENEEHIKTTTSKNSKECAAGVDCKPDCPKPDSPTSPTPSSFFQAIKNSCNVF